MVEARASTAASGERDKLSIEEMIFSTNDGLNQKIKPHPLMNTEDTDKAQSYALEWLTSYSISVISVNQW